MFLLVDILGAAREMGSLYSRILRHALEARLVHRWNWTPSPRHPQGVSLHLLYRNQRTACQQTMHEHSLRN